jgi:hypothetical protein
MVSRGMRGEEALWVVSPNVHVKVASTDVAHGLTAEPPT